MHCSSRSLLITAFGPALRRTNAIPPAFLIPSFQTSPFSTSTPLQARKDGNPSRGVSALRRTGLSKRQRGSSSVIPAEGPVVLPKPVLEPESHSAVQVDESHGLYDFFNDERAAMMTPSELAAHGRAWSVQELRRKDWEDLHRLWWVCIKEKNRISTFKSEKNRVGTMYGDYEADERSKQIRATMRGIKFVLTERWYTWENARNVAMQDDEVNLYANPDAGEQAYQPRSTEPLLEDGLTAEGSESGVYTPMSDQLPPRPLAPRNESMRV